MVIVAPRVAEAGRGFGWWAEGWRIFMASPGTWIGLMVVYCVLSVLVSIVPFVGAVGQSLLTPVFLGGLMIGCRALSQGEPLRMSHLFEGFQGPHFVPLMIIGAVNIGLVVALMLLSGAGFLGGVAMPSSFDPTNPLAAGVGAMTATTLVVFVLVLLVAAVFTMLNWFAPALVALRGVSAVEAMKLSFVASLRNWLPFLTYGLVVVVVGVVVTVAFVIVAFMFGAGALMSGSLERGIGAFLGFFALVAFASIVLAVIVGPIAIGSIYAGFKDTLDDDDATVTNPAYR